MIFEKTALEGAYLIHPEKIEDERGFFARMWCKKEFEKRSLATSLVQHNISYNKKRGTLRGMHYQLKPYEETKIVMCIVGSIFDVIIDLRPESSTYKKWAGFELSAENRSTLYVPNGFAHGYITLLDDSEFFYRVSEFYHPEAERGIRWNDPEFQIEWPIRDNLIMSEKDSKWPDYLQRK